jgi:hypothetical protein
MIDVTSNPPLERDAAIAAILSAIRQLMTQPKLI